jgi:hypothetical protein
MKKPEIAVVSNFRLFHVGFGIKGRPAVGI